MPRSGPRTVCRYSEEFKLTAVRLSQQPGFQVQTVASALAIHPFMLSKWCKDAREGRLRGRAPKAPAAGPARELARLQPLELEYAPPAGEMFTTIRVDCLRDLTATVSRHIASRSWPRCPSSSSNFSTLPTRRSSSKRGPRSHTSIQGFSYTSFV